MGKVWNFPHIGWYEVNETFEINVELSLYDVGGSHFCPDSTLMPSLQFRGVLSNGKMVR